MSKTLQGRADGIAYLMDRITVAAQTGCWNWRQSVGNHGYGLAYWSGSRYTAHRLSYALHHGDPGKLCVLHRCGNRRCCNPEHLYAGTRRDNHLDCVRDGTHIPPPRLKGEQIGNARLTDAQAAGIKRRIWAGEEQSALAAEFGVSRSTISLIGRGLRYAHVEPSMAGYTCPRWKSCGSY